jgi:hypothetical protein
MIAGSVGMEFKSSGDHGQDLDTVNPLNGFWVYLKKEPHTEEKGGCKPGDDGEKGQKGNDAIATEAQINMFEDEDVGCYRSALSSKLKILKRVTN